jgi:hypothetical protein
VSKTLYEHVTVAETDYGAVLLDQKTGRYWQLNPTAALIIDTLLAGGSDDAAARAVASRFDVDEQRVREDIAELLERMTAAGVVKA